MAERVLVVPLDASQIPEGERKEQKIKVVSRDQKGRMVSAPANVASGKGEVKLKVDAAQTLDIVVGPESTPDEDLFRLQTVTVKVSPNHWPATGVYTLPPLLIPPFYWRFWLRWCRTFTITGRVVCANGAPVPGAHVSAFDVDFWWWWFSSQPVGPTVVTDANGAFAMTFRWCCGWWPWWWWRLRRWALEPRLASHILPAMRLSQRFKRLPQPGPVPNFKLFQELAPNFPMPPITRDFDPSILPKVRDIVLPSLPALPELERLRIWPWWPWTPWLDCSPDVIFRVTQDCQGQIKTIVNEHVFQTRWDIPTHLDVTLVANNEACCLGGGTTPEGNCLVITNACGVVVGDIGGNPGALPAIPPGYPAIPLGYADPGGADRPFAGYISVSGQFGSGANVAYYEFETTQTPAVPASWTGMLAPAIGGFGRQYWNGVTWPTEPFPLQMIDGHAVIESREHFESISGPRFWEAFGQNLLGYIYSENNLADGVHHFRLKAYDIDGAGHLQNPRVLPLCLTQEDNGLALRIDNRFVDTLAPFTPPATSPGQPCGDGTVHFCTEEPDTQILAVRVNGVALQACGTSTIRTTDPVEIDFFVYDPDGHLDKFELHAKYDVNSSKDLLGVGTLSTIPAVPPVPSADHVGPTYGHVPPATRPSWTGGVMRLSIPQAKLAFPETCCYLIELLGYKRNIVNCSSPPYYNQSHLSVTVIVA